MCEFLESKDNFDTLYYTHPELFPLRENFVGSPSFCTMPDERRHFPPPSFPLLMRAARGWHPLLQEEDIPFMRERATLDKVSPLDGRERMKKKAAKNLTPRDICFMAERRGWVRDGQRRGGRWKGEPKRRPDSFAAQSPKKEGGIENLGYRL